MKSKLEAISISLYRHQYKILSDSNCRSHGYSPAINQRAAHDITWVLSISKYQLQIHTQGQSPCDPTCLYGRTVQDHIETLREEPPVLFSLFQIIPFGLTRHRDAQVGDRTSFIISSRVCVNLFRWRDILNMHVEYKHFESNHRIFSAAHALLGGVNVLKKKKKTKREEKVAS